MKASGWPARALGTAALVALPRGALAEGGLRKGPWVMNPQGDAITVLVEREEPGPVTVTATPEGGQGAPVAVQSFGASRMHGVRLSGLTAGVRYRYVVTGPGLDGAAGGFLMPSEGPVRFVVYGDTRSDEDAHALAARAIAREGAAFVLHTGDLVADGRDAEDWDEFFTLERELLRGSVFLPVLGNHEILSAEREGIANYRRYVDADPSGPSPELDTTWRWGRLRVVLANAFEDWHDPERLRWLDRVLGDARREAPDGWLFVVFHWGLNSSGPHGPNRDLRGAEVEALLRRHRTDLVLAGHDHLYERGDDQGLRYLVSGGAGAPLYPVRHRSPSTRFATSEHHYVRGELDGDHVAFTALRPDGVVLERCVLEHTRWRCDAPPEVPSAPSTTSPPRRRRGRCTCEVPGLAPGRAPVPWVALGLLCGGGVRSRRASSARR